MCLNQAQRPQAQPTQPTQPRVWLSSWLSHFVLKSSTEAPSSTNSTNSTNSTSSPTDDGHVHTHLHPMMAPGVTRGSAEPLFRRLLYAAATRSTSSTRWVWSSLRGTQADNLPQLSGVASVIWARLNPPSDGFGLVSVRWTRIGLRYRARVEPPLEGSSLW